jgi:hypothetical protein
MFMKKSTEWAELPLETIKQGYRENRQFYECLICGREVEKGMIYKDGDGLYEARRYMELHGSVFAYLVGLDKR